MTSLENSDDSNIAKTVMISICNENSIIKANKALSLRNVNYAYIFE